MKRANRRSRAGFTLVEVSIVLVIVGILAAIAAPSLFAYMERGRQINRNNIARILYNTAQSQLTALRITGELKAAHTPLYYTNGGGTYEENAATLTSFNNVYGNLGYIPSGEEDASNYVHYIGKASGPWATEVANVTLLARILDGAVVDKAVLDNAILVEYNIQTGRVLSVFYGDRADQEAGFDYVDDDSNRDIIGGRGMDVYSGTADVRRQGYYGVGNTGIPDMIEDVSIDIRDGYLWPLPLEPFAADGDQSRSSLYVDILIPQRLFNDAGNYNATVTIESPAGTPSSIAATFSTSSSINSLNAATTASQTSDGEVIYYAGGGDGGFERFIWVLDHVYDDDMRARASSVFTYFIERADIRVNFNTAASLRARITGPGVSELSETQAHPYYGGITGGEYLIRSARHLHNIRYLASEENARYRQDEEIDLSAYKISNFEPIRAIDGGAFRGTYNGNGRTISSLTIAPLTEFTAPPTTGLFGRMSGTVTNLTLDNPDVSGENAGALCGELAGTADGISIVNPVVAGTQAGGLCGSLNGTARNILIRYDTNNTRTINGTDAAGGIAGAIGGTLNSAVFISPNNMVHVTGGNPGGIAGSVGGTLLDIQFLALAPIVNDGVNPVTINPISGTFTGTATNTYYLSGAPVRPETASLTSLGRSGYNMETPTLPALGRGLTTYEMYRDMFDLFEGNWTKHIDVDADSKMVTELTQNEVENAGNEQYPYPYIPGWAASGWLPGHPDWPIAVNGVEITLSNLYYFEKYNDSSYGLWCAEDAEDEEDAWLINMPALNNNKPILEAGYMIIGNWEEEPKDLHLYALPNSTSPDWTLSDTDTGKNKHHVMALDFTWVTDLGKMTGDSAGDGEEQTGFWVATLGLDALAAKLGYDRSVPLLLAYASNSNGIGATDVDSITNEKGLLHPLFARAIWLDGVEGTIGQIVDIDSKTHDNSFDIRTPWQMANISGFGGEGNSLVFSQSRDIDFEADRGEKTGDGTTVLMEGRNAVVTGDFKNTYLGNFHSISNVELDSEGDGDDGDGEPDEDGDGDDGDGEPDEDGDGEGGKPTGLFEENAGVIMGVILQNSRIIGQDKTGGIAGVNSSKIAEQDETGETEEQDEIGVISLCGVEYSTVEGKKSVGGIAGENSGYIEDVYFLSIEKEPAEPDSAVIPVSGSDRVGGIVGWNDEDTGKVSYAFYLAPAPSEPVEVKSTDASEPVEVECIFPIVGSGKVAEKTAGGAETCFYLMGSRYILNGASASDKWNPEWYNIPKGDSEDKVKGKVEGGGEGRNTAHLRLEWLNSDAITMDPAWKQRGRSDGYAYPYLGAEAADWPLADGGIRPGQDDRDDWSDWLAARERTEKLNFINGDFEDPFMNPLNTSQTFNVRTNTNLTGNMYFPSGASPANNGTNTNGPLYVEPVGNPPQSSPWQYYDHNWIQGWNTKPVVEAWQKQINDAYKSDAVADVNWSYWYGLSAEQRNNLSTANRYWQHVRNFPWYAIELQIPTKSSDPWVQWWGRQTRTNYRGGTNGVYAELNAAVQGILYQNVDTSKVQGTELYYSFHHAARTWVDDVASNREPGNSNAYVSAQPSYEKMSFSLSEIVQNPNYLASQQRTLYSYNHQTDQFRYANATDADPYGTPTVIRPCQTDRGTFTSTLSSGWAFNVTYPLPLTRNTIDYKGYYDVGTAGYRSDGKVSFYDPVSGKMETEYLYDVWIGSISAETSATQPRGYGITFWLKDHNEYVVDNHGYKDLADLIKEAKLNLDEETLKKRIVGYWDVPSYNYDGGWKISEWKQYYGLYTVPEGQTMTEFGFRSDSYVNATQGNYLDGVVFKSPGFLSVDTYIKDAKGENDVMYTRPEENLTVITATVNYGEAAVDNIVVTNRFDPFDAYIEYTGNVKVYPVTVTGGTVTRGTALADDQYTATMLEEKTAVPDEDDKRFLEVKIHVPLAGVTDNNVYSGYQVEFTIQVREYVEDDSDDENSTMKYYFRNQGEVSYYDAGYPGYSLDGREKFEPKPADGEKPKSPKTNASGPEPLKVFIEPVKLTSRIETKDYTGDDPLTDGPFRVTVRVEIDPNDTKSKALGVIRIRIPDEFEASEPSRGSVSGGWLTVGNVRLDGTDSETKWVEVSYTLTYKGDDYGVIYAGNTASYEYVYTSEDDIYSFFKNSVAAEHDFPRLVAGITAKAAPAEFSFDKSSTIEYFDILDLSGLRDDDGYAVIPDLILKQPDGTDATANHYTVLEGGTPLYSVTYNNANGLILTAAEGKNLDYDMITVEYYIRLTPTKAGGRPAGFTLTSETATVILRGITDTGEGQGSDDDSDSEETDPDEDTDPAMMAFGLDRWDIDCMHSEGEDCVCEEHDNLLDASLITGLPLAYIIRRREKFKWLERGPYRVKQ